MMQRLSRMRDYARSRREAEDGVCIAHGPTDGVHARVAINDPLPIVLFSVQLLKHLL